MCLAGVGLSLLLVGCVADAGANDGSVSSKLQVQGETVASITRELTANVERWSDNWDGWCGQFHSREGATVTINDEAGVTVGVAKLSAPSARDVEWESQGSMGQGAVSGECVSTFSASVDSDSEFFAIEVEGVSGAVDLTRAELDAGPALKVPK